MKLFTCFLASILCCLAGSPSVLAQPAAELEVTGYADPSKTIPLALTGYSGEAEATLRFDLEVAGFQITSQDAARYLLTGGTAGQVEGRLSEKATKASLLAKAYSGGTARSQAHALADDVVQAILGKPGIARTKIVFKAESGNDKEVYVSDYDGQNAVAVTQDKTIVAAPTWVPGKRALFYTSYKSGYPDIYYHDLNTGDRKIIARYPGLNTSAAVSPDGKKVAMILSKGGSPDLYVCDADGSNLVQLTRTKEDESSPCWSPDGRKICFVARLSERRSLAIIPSTGGQTTRLATDGVLNPSEPDWSPDGKSIVFTSQMGGFNICTVPSGGGLATVLTNGEDPSWAPNSRTVVFVRRVNNKRVLSLLDVTTKRVKDTAQKLGSCSQPSWAK